MRNVHIWKTTTEDGEKREVRAEKFGKKYGKPKSGKPFQERSRAKKER